MSVLAPPPPQDELELLIREARSRQRRRWLVAAVVTAVLAGLGLTVWAAVPGGGSSALTHAPRPASSGQGQFTAPSSDRREIDTVGMSGGVTWTANGRGLWLTTDEGRSWRYSVPPDIAAAPGGWRVNRSFDIGGGEIQFIDDRHGWMAGISGVDRTTDGGRTWQSSVLGDCHRCWPAGISFLDARRGFFLQSGPDANKLFRTNDGGRTWRLVSSPPVSGPITFVNGERGFAFREEVIEGPYGGPRFGHLYRTNDGGVTWSRDDIRGLRRSIDVALGVFGHHVVAVQNGANPKGGLNLKPETMEVSADAGTSWGGHAIPDFVSADPSFSIVSPTVWVWSSMNDLFTTTDAGQHWRKIVVRGLPRAWNAISHIAFTSSRVGWAAFGVPRRRQDWATARVFLFRTSDGGRHWTATGPRKPKSRRVRGR